MKLAFPSAVSTGTQTRLDRRFNKGKEEPPQSEYKVKTNNGNFGQNQENSHNQLHHGFYTLQPRTSHQQSGYKRDLNNVRGMTKETSQLKLWKRCHHQNGGPTFLECKMVRTNKCAKSAPTMSCNTFSKSFEVLTGFKDFFVGSKNNFWGLHPVRYFTHKTFAHVSLSCICKHGAGMCNCIA